MEPAAENHWTLRRMERALVRADLEHPGTIPGADLRQLRYLLGFARLTEFVPGIARQLKSERRGIRAVLRRRTSLRREVSVAEQVEPFRSLAIDRLRGPLRTERDPLERLRLARVAVEELAPALERARAEVIDGHRGEFSAVELDAEAGSPVLVSVAGGGGGAGYVYIGAYRRLEEAGIVPAHVVGASIGAVLGLFRARAAAPDWDAYEELARRLDRRRLFSAVALRRRFGLPGLLALDLRSTIGDQLRDDNGAALRIADLEIPYEAVVAGIRRRSIEGLPAEYQVETSAPPDAVPTTRRSPGALAPAVAKRLAQAVSFFDPEVTKPVSLGADALSADLDAIDAAGFSAAIPGVLHYDVAAGDERMGELMRRICEREEVAALVDGGVVANVPAEIAWRGVQSGRLGTRNAIILGFDCFHPRWGPAQFWLQPITQAIQLQTGRNARYADWMLRIDPTLSPVNLVPSPDALDRAIGWGRDAVEDVLPMLERMLDPVWWEPLDRRGVRARA